MSGSIGTVGNSYLLDTNIVAAYFNKDQAVVQQLLNVKAVVSSTVIGELFFGAYNSRDIINNLNQIRHFITLNTVLYCDSVTGDIYGQIKVNLKKKGRPIPENDIWIAAIAQQYKLTLVTRDSDFQYVDNLQVVKW